jgi:replication factor A1
MNFEQMIQEILGSGKIGYDELMSRIKRRQDELSGFVTPEGAAMIVGRELGVELVKREPEIRELNIEDLMPGMSNVDIVGRVTRIHEPRTFERTDGSAGRVANLILQDKTGQVKVVLWDDKVPLIEEGKIQKGMALRVKGAYLRQGFDKQPEINVGLRSLVVSNPDDPRAADLPSPPEVRIKVTDLKPDMNDVDFVGRVMASSEPRTFERPDRTSGKVATLMLTDETGQVRVSLWDERAELVRKIKRGDVVKLENAYSRIGLREKPELHLGWRGRLLLNPPETVAVELPRREERLLKIEEVETDMPVIDVAGRVRRKFQPHEFRRNDGSTGKVMSVILADETGVIRASFWNDMVALAEKLSLGDVLLLRNVYARAGLADRPEIQVGRAASVEVNPSGVVVGELEPSRIGIGEIEPGMDALEVIGRVVEVAGPRDFTRADGSRGKVATLVIGDQTGTIRASLWQEHADEVMRIKVGDIVKLINCYSAIGMFGQPEVHLGRQGKLEVNPTVAEELPPADVLSMAASAPEGADIVSLQKEGMRAQLRGTIVQVFHRRPLFDVCPSCGRSLGSVDSSLMCEECGKVVKPEHRVVLSFVVDDGTGNIRAVLFGRVAEKLLGMSTQQVFDQFKQLNDLVELYKKFDLIGREVILAGTTRYDKYFGQLELMVNEVQIPDPKREARNLLERIKADASTNEQRRRLG